MKRERELQELPRGHLVSADKLREIVGTIPRYDEFGLSVGQVRRGFKRWKAGEREAYEVTE